MPSRHRHKTVSEPSNTKLPSFEAPTSSSFEIIEGGYPPSADKVLSGFFNIFCIITENGLTALTTSNSKSRLRPQLPSISSADVRTPEMLNNRLGRLIDGAECIKVVDLGGKIYLCRDVDDHPGVWESIYVPKIVTINGDGTRHIDLSETTAGTLTYMTPQQAESLLISYGADKAKVVVSLMVLRRCFPDIL